MEAHVDKTPSKMVSESRKMMKEETLEIRGMFSSVMEKLDNINVHVTPRQKKCGAMQLFGDSSHQNNISLAVSPEQQHESA
eukprot:14491877-Ditylum_brightwellii.AAC.2